LTLGFEVFVLSLENCTIFAIDFANSSSATNRSTTSAATNTYRRLCPVLIVMYDAWLA